MGVAATPLDMTIKRMVMKRTNKGAKFLEANMAIVLFIVGCVRKGRTTEMALPRFSLVFKSAETSLQHFCASSHDTDEYCWQCASCDV